MSTISPPTRAKIVIIGGGVGGTSVAYHLGQAGERDVVLVDRNELTSGSTFHSAGLVGQLRADPTLTKMNMHSVQLYRDLELTDTPPGWRESGSIKLASSPERMQEIRRQIGWARTFGLDLHEISPAEAQQMFPLIDLDGVVGACYMASDGEVDPSQLTNAMASGARQRGVKIVTNTRVVEIVTRNGRVTGVVTDKGAIECEVVVNCGGMYAPSIGRLVGVRIPIVPMSHQYVITENFLEPGALRLPSLRDPDNLVYWRQEVSGLLMGGYERSSKPFSTSDAHVDAIPADFNSRLLDPDWERFEEIAVNSQRRVPIMGRLGVKNFINGPEGFTPDNEFCLGETEVGGFYVAAGFCAHGIAGAGGIGEVMAQWVLSGEPPADLWHMDVRRFGASYQSPSFTLQRVRENYEAYYDIHYPGEERRSARPLKMSPVYDWHKNSGAVFGEKAGWERVNYYRPHETDSILRPFGWAGKHWSSAVAIEHRSTRDSAGLFDESSFAKFTITGRRASEFLNKVCANDIDRGVGRTVYTQVLNTRGGIECDFTVTRTKEETFLIVTGTAFGTHDMGVIKKHARDLGFEEIVVADVTSELACFGLWGPSARNILARVTDADISADGFKFLHSREIIVGGILTRATRITYVGELGWEFYAPIDRGLELWNVLLEAGRQDGLMACGYRAIESLRLEKGYRAWGVEINSDTTPWEAGLGFAVALAKPNFVGRDALVSSRGSESKRLATIHFEDIRRVPLGNEPISIGGEVVGRVKSGGQGFTIGKAIANAYLPVAHCSPGTSVDVEFFGEWVAGTVI